jgi:hypothetical protein
MSCLYIHNSFPHRFNFHPNAAKAIGLKLQALAALRRDPELIEACGSVEIKHFPQCSSDSRHHGVVEARDRAFDRAAVVDRAKLSMSKVESRRSEDCAVTRRCNGSASSIRFVVNGMINVEGWPASICACAWTISTGRVLPGSVLRHPIYQPGVVKTVYIPPASCQCARL